MSPVFIVTYSREHEAPHRIGDYASLDEAERAARTLGATGQPTLTGHHTWCYEVEDHEDCGIWIERV
jgi:hypothetical protein